MILKLNIIKKCAMSVILVAHFFYSTAQKRDYNWCFGDSAGINFNTIPPTTFKSSINSTECAASISDNNGNLLFYAGAKANAGYTISIWNKNDSIMQNADNLYGHSSETNGVLILPFFNDTNKFHIFHILGPSGVYLYKSIVDLSYNNGLGKVTTKNSLLYSATDITEKQIAVRHANGRNWWLILHQKANNTFIKFLIANDLITGPFLQSIGSSDTIAFGGDMGEMEVSQDGDKIVATNLWGVIDLFDFDRCTGTLSNWVDLGYKHFIDYSGCAFSSKGNRLYVSQARSLFQFDLTADTIVNSKKTIGGSPVSYRYIDQLQLGPDGKIYVANAYTFGWPDTLFNTYNMNLSVINEPNSLGTACNFQPYSFYLGGRRSYASLPNMPNYNLGALAGSVCDTLVDVRQKTQDRRQEKLTIFPNPAREFVTIGTINSIQGANIVITDLLGKVVYEECVQPNTNYSKISVKDFPEGVYIVKVQGKGFLGMEKFLKW